MIFFQADQNFPNYLKVNEKNCLKQNFIEIH